MQIIRRMEDMMKQINKMNKQNAISHFHIPGKGKFTVVLKEEDNHCLTDEMKHRDGFRASSDYCTKASHLFTIHVSKSN